MYFWGDRRVGVKFRRARGLIGRDEGKIATGRFPMPDLCVDSK